MEKIENILYSLAPLIIIIFLSWLFSYMGSRARRQAASAPKESESQSGDRIMEMLMGKQVDEMPSDRRDEVAGPRPAPSTSMGGWNNQRLPSGPEPTPKPIKPRWWGA
jgi:hypothetical protein